jgi:glycerol-3-phosphate O-acyltransferase
MTQTVAVPLWLLILIGLFATVTFASHFLFPSVRWFFRRRAERLIAHMNTRLTRPIEPFKLARRYDMIQRLSYDPAVTEAIVDYARENGVPENVAFEKAQGYAREIVPSFSATAYFTFGIRLARWLSKAIYRVRVGEFDRDRLEEIDPDAAVVFVINHRSNMDYVLVTWLVSQNAVLSYAVGEWARVWPLSGVIRMMGAYFIRRKSRGALYRRVLARYVQMATSGGVTQAIFPEGGLSLTGAPAEPRLGLLNYIVEGQVPGGRDVIFVPVGLNYDRVLEDKILIKAGESGRRRFRPPIFAALWGTVRYLFRFLTLRFRHYGTASVGFGRPLSLADFAAGCAGDPTEAVGDELMARVREVIPVVPVPLVATELLQAGPLSAAELEARVVARLRNLAARGVPVPRRDPVDIAREAVDRLRRRGLVLTGATIRPAAGAEPILRYYANSIAHHLSPGDDARAATVPDISAAAKQ